jgi:hypothetical protein
MGDSGGTLHTYRPGHRRRSVRVLRHPVLYPERGIPVRTPQELWAALLAAGTRSHDTPTVRAGFAEGADLVAEFRIVGRAARSLFGRHHQECEEFQVRMWFDVADHQVSSVDHVSEFTLTLGDPPRRRNTSWADGQLSKRYVAYAWTRTPEGRRTFSETTRFDSGVLKRSLQSVTLAHGWSWRPLIVPPGKG